MFNFSASHDGIGLRPVEGLLPEDEIDRMTQAVQGFGGRLTMRSYGAREVPYEMNTTLFCALKGTVNGPDAWQIDRFIASQTIMMSVEGIPAFYVQSFSLVKMTKHWLPKQAKTAHSIASNGR